MSFPVLLSLKMKYCNAGLHPMANATKEKLNLKQKSNFSCPDGKGINKGWQLLNVILSSNDSIVVNEPVLLGTDASNHYSQLTKMLYYPTLKTSNNSGVIT